MENTLNDEIKLVTPRAVVEIHLPDGRVLCGPRGTPVAKFLCSLPEWRDIPPMGAVVNEELRELTFPIEMDARVKPVTMTDSDGARIYRRSLTFLLVAAFEALFPGVELAIDHSVASGGFFCHLINRQPLHENELKRLEQHMRSLVEADLPFERRKVPLDEAIEFFHRRGQLDKVHLMKYRQKADLVLYRLGDHHDYHHGYMVPSTGYIRWFDLLQMGEGFVVRFPRRHMPTELLPIPESPKLLDTFLRYGHWLSRLGIDSVAPLNDAIKAGRISEIILVSEALHEQEIADIARKIVAKHREVRIVLVAGPSSSGKTTFSKRLAVQLLAQGISPMPLELDNYFVNREDTPLDENRKYDYESLGALNTKLLAEQLRCLISGEEVQLPRFDFITGRSVPGEAACLEPDQLIILEGIHGLNPQLLPDIPSQQTFRLYVSCLTQLNLDRYNRISTTDTRLIRRIVRDARERGYSAQQTISMWESVRRGEKRNIYAYQDYADEMFTSALAYELSALKPLAMPLLRQVPFGTPEYIEAKRLYSFLEWFLPLDPDLVPDNSILREFIGGSILKEFKLWEHAD